MGKKPLPGFSHDEIHRKEMSLYLAKMQSRDERKPASFYFHPIILLLSLFLCAFARNVFFFSSDFRP
jgi:hypothetical protein